MNFMMIKRIAQFWMVACFCFFYTLLPAQSPSITDSLVKVLQSFKADTNRVNMLDELGQRLSATGDYKTALKYEIEALDLAEKLKFIKGVVFVQRNMGNIYIMTGDYPEALKNINAALKICKEIGDKKGIAFSYGNIGTVYYLQGNYPEALKNYFISLRLKEEIGDKKGIAGAYNNIANIYTKQSNYPEALKQYFASLKIREEMGDKKGIATCYNNIGTIYDTQNNYPEAIKNFEASLKLKNELKDKNGIAYAYNNIGIVYFHKGEFTDALENYRTAVKIFEEIGDKRGIVNASGDIGRVLARQATLEKGQAAAKKFAESHHYLNRGLLLAKEIGDKDGIKDYYQYLSEADSAQANFAQALVNYKLYILYKDSLLNEETNRQMAQMKIGYETNKKDREIELLELQNRQQVTMIVASATLALVLIVIVLLIILSRRRLKKTYLIVNKQKEEIECQKKEVEITLDKLRMTKTQLIQSEKMASLGMLTAGIAHEINNPVNFINSGAISLQRDYEDLQKIIASISQLTPGTRKLADELGLDELLKIIPQTLDDVKLGVQRTTEIVRGLRNFTRMDASELREVDLHEGINSTLLLLNHKVKDHIGIVRDFDPNLRFIKCYPGPLNQVFMNLLNNAIDAINQKIQQVASHEKTAQGPYQIGITTRLTETGEKKQVKIVFSDNGIGIPEEIRNKLFDPFFTTKEVGKGTGLGLSICHGIIEKHGGSITCETKVSEGSAFTITIPV